MMDTVRTYSKAIAAFVLPLLVNMVISLIQNDQPWPTTPEEWVRYLGTSLAVGLGVASVPNKVTPKQAAKSGVTGAEIEQVHAEKVEKAEKSEPLVVVPPLPPLLPPPPPDDKSVVDRIIADYEKQ